MGNLFLRLTLYDVAVDLRGAFTALVSTSKRRIGEGDYPFSPKIVFACYYRWRLFVGLVLGGPADRWDESGVVWRRAWTLKLQLGLVGLITTTAIHRARFQRPLSHAIPKRQSRMGLGYPSLS